MQRPGMLNAVFRSHYPPSQKNARNSGDLPIAPG
jgi:hypothetical protein